MAIINPKKLGQGAVTTGAGLLVYTTPSGGVMSIVKCLDVCNTNASAVVTVSLYLVPLAGTAATSNALFAGVVIPAGGSYQWTGTQVLESGGFIQVIGSATGGTINAAGAECLL